MTRRLDGSLIQSGTITSTQLSSSVANSISAGGGPRVASLIYPGNDTAGNTAGGQTVYINGSGFETNNAIYINGNAVPSKAFISASNLSFTTPALSAGIYPVYVINTDTGATAIFVPGYVSSAEPTWVTGATLSSQEATGTWNIPLSASGDAPITYALAGGSSLPSGITLAANGLISGTLSSPPNDETQYSFTVVATDAQNQDASRAFNVTASVGEGVLFANNVLLIHADGTNNGNNHAFIDSSNNNFTITRNGNATQGSFSPFSQTGWSNYFNGSSALLAAGTTDFQFGTGDFTVESFIFIANTSTGDAQYINGTYDGGDGGYALYISSGSASIAFRNGDAGVVTRSYTFSANKWYHVAVTRSSSTLRFFVDGAQVGADENSYTQNINRNNSQGGASIGRYAWSGAPGGYFQGYISNLRVVKGTALYTGSYTKPTSTLSAVANTVLLTCQSNRFIDTNTQTTAKTITITSSPSVQAFSPFAPGVAYSTANNGASGYFDGSDSFSVSSGSGGALNFGSGDFTVESWIYPTTSFGATQYMLFGNTAVGGATFRITDSSLIIDRYNQAKDLDGGHTNQPYSWAHVAFVREGSTLRVYKNGVQLTSASTSSSYDFTSFSLASGAGLSTYAGYFSGLRAVKGQCLYPGGTTFTVPTSPPTNVANTQFLCNFTNAQIFDQTAKNVIETVGDAKVSTSVYKYGTGSIAFDGTGDYLKFPSTILSQFGSGDFTIEGWVYTTNISSLQIFLNRRSVLDARGLSIYFENSKINFRAGDSNDAAWEVVIDSGTLSSNTWYHFALTRSGNVWRAFVNGTQVGSNTTWAGTIGDETSNWIIGIGNDGSSYGLTGYLDDLRFTKGQARYTSNFTAPTSALRDK